MTNASPTILIIVGITGDLVKRKLLPAIGEIAETGCLPEQFHIIGTTRQTNISTESIIGTMPHADYIREHLSLLSLDMHDRDAYAQLAAHIEEIEQQFASTARCIWYLAVPPEVLPEIVPLLGTSLITKKADTKLILEKPFGMDSKSAKALIDEIDLYFHPNQICRVDHFLAKEMAQNLITFREQNALFRRTWNNKFIERIQILASEAIGIEGRANFYEQTGALRDTIQSHLLELAAIVIMDPLAGEKESAMPERRLAALQSVSIRDDKPIHTYVHRGQYEKYREEVGNSESVRETYASITLFSNSPEWEGVPITLTTGKMLDKKVTEIHIFYKKDHEQEANELVLRLHPEAGIFVRLWTKQPGYEKQIEKQMFQFTYKEHYTKWPEGYEQVLIDALRDDQSLCVSRGEIMESWRIVDAIEKAWEESSDDLVIYEPGTPPYEIGK